MELRILHYFLAVVREGNMTKAAEKLHLTQPTLSRQIMQLEEELGVTLFDRTHNLQLTSDGIVLQRKAQEILNLVDQTKQSFQQAEKPLTGTIRIGTSEYAHVSQMMHLFAGFQQRHPYITFSFYTGDMSEIEEKLQHHDEMRPWSPPSLLGKCILSCPCRSGKHGACSFVKTRP